MPGFIGERREQIIEAVRERGFVTIEALAAHFDVSSQTVRRDIIELDAQGLIRRFHGGAGPSEKLERKTYQQKKTLQSLAKTKIGRKTASLIPGGASIFIDVGTTAEAAAEALYAHHNLTVFTCSCVVALLCGNSATASVELAGGILDGPDGAVVGSRTTQWVSRLRIDYALISCSAIEADGSVLDFNSEKVEVKKAAMAAARCSILMADHTKFDRRASFKLAELPDFDHLVVDQLPQSVSLESIEREVAVVIAND